MLPPLPNLHDYGLTPSSGFLPEGLPLERLPNPYYGRWESVVKKLQPLLMTRRLRDTVDKLPVLTTKLLKGEAEWRRAYLILAFLAHAYIWGGRTPQERVPPSISKPFKEVCAHLGLPLVATYSAVCLWNWKPIFSDESIDDLDNITTLSTFTGATDESWFYLVSVAIESRGAPLVPILLEGMAAARRGDPKTLTHALQLTAERIDELGSILTRMYEQCDPHIFYHKIRPYLAGSKNMADAGLPNGVLFDTGCGDDEYVQYGGGSNAQSPIMQFFDIALGVEHRPTGTTKFSAKPGPSAQAPPMNFILDMRKYMTAQHRRFLEDVAGVANIRAFVEHNRGEEALMLAYDSCLAMLRSLRDKHIQMVTRYIIVKSGEKQPSHVSKSLNLANVRKEGSGEKGRLTGTGGTALIPFLKQARDETSEGIVDSWARRLLTDTPMSHKNVPLRTGLSTNLDRSAGAEQDRDKVLGLAGRWDVDDTEGGICHW